MITPVLLLLVASTEPRLQEAERLVDGAEHGAAATLYDALLREGRDGAGLRYNRGTLALDEGDVGAAVLHLLAAHRLDPLDDDIAWNLRIALSRRADRMEGARGDGVPAMPGDALPPDAVRALCGVCLLLLGVLLAATAWISSSSRSGRIVRVCVRAAVVCALASSTALALRVRAERRTIAVLLQDAEARRAPDPHAELAFTGHAGLCGDVVDEQADFVRVRLENGLDAWLPRSALGFAGPRR